MTSSPGCASIERPSMVTVTVVFGAASSVERTLSSGMGGLARFAARACADGGGGLDVEGDRHAAAGDLGLELRAEASDGAHHRGHGGGAERADRGLAGWERHRCQAGLLEGGGGIGA